MKVVTRVKGLLAAAVAAAGLVAFAEPVVEITKAWQANPGSGVVDFTYEVRNLEGVGVWAYDVIVRVEAKDCENTYTFTNENVSAGSVTTNIDYKAMLGDVYANVSIYATLEKRPGGVQLWEGGPYFAECNVGASKPEEYGYYFWWGDTVGYTNTVGEASGSGTWVSVKDSTTTIPFSASDATSKQTYDHDQTWLKSYSWIGDDGNLVLAHDAARAHLGAPWRMMTQEELDKLTSKTYCKWKWVTSYNGKSVKGYVVNGAKDPYMNNEVFFPAAGCGFGASLNHSGVNGYYWSSTPRPDSYYAWYLSFYSSGFCASYNHRYYGQSVRPVR